MSFLKKTENGVVSLEACIMLPIFILLILFFYGLMVAFSGEQVVCHALVQSAESLSLDPYATDRVNTDLSKMEKGADLIQTLYAGMFRSNEYFSSSEKWYDDEDKMINTVKNRFLGYIAGSSGDNPNIKEIANSKLKTLGVQNGVDGIDFSETKIEDNVLTITLKYKQEYIFNFQGLAAFDRTLSVSVTLWKK